MAAELNDPLLKYGTSGQGRENPMSGAGYARMALDRARRMLMANVNPAN